MCACLQNKQLSIEVNPFGAVLTSVRACRSGHEFLWQGDPAVWNGQSPILFPIIGRLADDTCRIDGKSYEIIRHGIARHRPFALVSQTPSELVFLQTSDRETRQSYPYDYELYVRFKLSGDGLTVQHTVHNPNDRTMYFSIGAHPAFNCALGDTLVFEQKETLKSERINTDSLLTGEADPILHDEDTLTLHASLFDKDALIFENVQSDYVTLHCRQSRTAVRFFFGKVPFLAIWAKPAAPFVCIEPWHGINDPVGFAGDFSKKRGIEALAAGESFSFSWYAAFLEDEEPTWDISGSTPLSLKETLYAYTAL